MKKLLGIVAAALAGLVLAAPAAAKEMTLLQVCGTNGCKGSLAGALVSSAALVALARRRRPRAAERTVPA